jgi:eukaryotic-like serine/threonine-protein kinase
MSVSVLSKLKKWFGSKPKSNLPRIDVQKRFGALVPAGQGSMSKVYKTRDPNIGRMVCLKVLDKEKTARFEARFRGLQRPMEGAVLVLMKHKNVVQTYEYGLTTKGEQYIIMELIDGVGLNYLVENRKLAQDSLKINHLLQATDGLEYIHKQGYLHRDICPRNMMINGEGVLKIIDFGLAIPHRPEFVRPGNRTGTPDYLAPELIKRQTTDQRVDMFALGVTAYEVFTNTLPWERHQSIQTLQSHVNIPGRDPRDFRKDLPESVAKFLNKAIERDPRQRFQTAGEFRDGLKALLNHLKN